MPNTEIFNRIVFEEVTPIEESPLTSIVTGFESDTQPEAGVCITSRLFSGDRCISSATLYYPTWESVS